MNTSDTDQKSPHDEPTGAREPYEPPQVISEEVFETLAVACGKTGGFGCAANGGINS
jgi:hypothetical protein